MKLTEQEGRVIEVFKQAGMHGQAFRTQNACSSYLDRTWKPGIMCPGYGRKIALEACNWHREEQDSLCLGCGRQTKENRKGVTSTPKILTGNRPQRYESV